MKLTSIFFFNKTTLIGKQWNNKKFSLFFNWDLFLKIHVNLKTVLQRDTQRSSSVHLLFILQTAMAEGGPGQNLQKLGQSKELHPGPPPGRRGQAPEPSLAAFPGALTENWIRREAAETQTAAHLRCWCHKQKIHFLRADKGWILWYNGLSHYLNASIQY